MYINRTVKIGIYLLPIALLSLSISIISFNIYDNRFEGRPVVKHLDYGKYYLSSDYRNYEVTKEEWIINNILMTWVVVSALLFIILSGIVGFYFLIHFVRNPPSIL